jgi:hypothetical protein
MISGGAVTRVGNGTVVDVKVRDWSDSVWTRIRQPGVAGRSRQQLTPPAFGVSVGESCVKSTVGRPARPGKQDRYVVRENVGVHRRGYVSMHPPSDTPWTT